MKKINYKSVFEKLFGPLKSIAALDALLFGLWIPVFTLLLIRLGYSLSKATVELQHSNSFPYAGALIGISFSISFLLVFLSTFKLKVSKWYLLCFSSFMISFTSILFLGGIRGILSTFAEFFLIFIFLLAVLVNSVVFTIESKKYLRLLKEADKLSKLDYLSFFIALLAIFIAVF